MGQELVAIEHDFQPLLPSLRQALAGRMPAERLVRTMLISIEKTPSLERCTRQSLFNSAMSAAVLGLEVDGVTGQAFLIPFENRKERVTNAQLVIGYKGMNTLGARSGYTITAACVRDGDGFEFELGSGAYVRHKPVLGSKGRIIGAWACGASKTMPPIVSVLSIDDLEAIRLKSPGAKKYDSPWNDEAIGLPAMYEKSGRRRLSRSMPLNASTRDYLLAARMEEAFDEQGKLSHLTPGGDLMIAESPLPSPQPSETPALSEIIGPKPNAETEDLRFEGLEAAALGSEKLAAWWKRLSPRQQLALKDCKDEELKPLAARADKGEA